MDELIDFMTHPKGYIGEIFGMNDTDVRDTILSAVRTLKNLTVLYIDTTHLITDCDEDMLYTDEYHYRAVMDMIRDLNPGPDLVILDNLYNIQDAPKARFLFHNLSSIMANKKFNLLVVNQMIHNFRYPHQSTDPYVSYYGSYFNRYAVLRVEIYKDTNKDVKACIHRNKMYFAPSIFNFV